MAMQDTQDPNAARRGEVVDGQPTIHAYQWDWSDAGQRRGLPWLGVFLVVFGALLLLRYAFPQLAGAGSLVTLALGIVLLVKWAIDRTAPALYAGALVTALGAPDLIEATGLVGGPGLGTLCLGIAFLAIAAVRAASSGGVGWQAYLGLILAVIGGSQLAIPAIAGLVLPALLVIGGIFLLVRAGRG
jgi:hypothetical protein